MPSLYSNIIRGKEVSEKKLISPPIIEKIYKKEIDEVENLTQKVEVNIDDIYKTIEKEAIEKGEEILESYREKAKKIIEESEKEARSIKETSMEEGFQEGYKKGYQEGYTFGKDEAKNEYENLISEASEIRCNAKKYIEECYRESRHYISSVENEFIDIIIEVSRKVINTELSQNNEAILSILESAILKCVDKKQVILKLSPKNSSVVKLEKNRISSLVDEKCNILILADNELEDNSFKIETTSGFVDASVEVQLEAIVQSLLGDSLQCIK
ncbi:FliH/SctL family protein [Clostridium cylindrosporum]|uniref:Flagellar assembly protein FliH/type III secretion system HrpE n=1 Tax=Clostridium cylindrosporum DSM 605 TaxID=1121307 RepID=A0A0J8G1S1_CLOCY|nr:FliH/SctL family protein [Clostridium cylindrosporum]KMT21701.1 flagellar assembly protein FliH/type III secretion system HrpE [Clostridium cylindrosporum DSM 605]